MNQNIAAEGTTNPIGLPWGEVVIAAIGFALLLVVLGKFVWPQFEKAFAARTKAIEGGIAKAEEAQNEAKAALDRYNQQLAGAREEAAKIREDARAQAQAIRDDMLAQAHAEAERIAAAGRAQLDAQRAQIVAELRADVRQVCPGYQADAAIQAREHAPQGGDGSGHARDGQRTLAGR